jgi:hypothetical protein
MGRDSVGNAGQGAHAAWQNHHGFCGVGTAGDVATDVSIRLLLNFARSVSEQLLDKVVAAAEVEFFGHDAQGAVGRYEVYGFNAFIALDGLQQMTQKNRATGASRGDGQVFGRDRHVHVSKVSKFQSFKVPGKASPIVRLKPSKR